MNVKLIAVVVTLLLTINSVFSQEYKNVTEYYDNGQIQVKGEKVSKSKVFKPQDESDWLATGVWKWFYADGTLLMKGSFQRGEIIGDWVAYYPNGKMFLKENTSNTSQMPKIIFLIRIIEK